MKKHLKKRLMAILLAFVMTLGMVPLDVYATEEITPSDTVTDGEVMLMDSGEGELPFTVTVNETEITQIAESELIWVDWEGTEMTVPCYTVTVPQKATEATFTFQEKMEWTYYNSQGIYLGKGESSDTPDTTHTIAIQDVYSADESGMPVEQADGELDGISMQIPNVFSTAYYILFVYEEGEPEPPCLTVLEDAPATAEVSAGGLYKLNLNTVFADSDSHGLEYSFTTSPAVENEHTKIAEDTFCFTTTEIGTYEVNLSAECGNGKTTEHELTITVKEANQGLDIQYDYEETDKSSVTVYVNIANDGMPIMAADGTVMANLKVTVPYFDLSLYGLEEYYRYGTENGRGVYVNENVIQRPTGLHLYIYLLERYYMGLPEDECCRGDSGVLAYVTEKDISYMTGDLAYSSNGKRALKTSGGATSIFMNEFWGHDCNLMYYRNHCYPYMTPGWGSTSDYILLSDGDCWDVAMFTDWGFYHSGYFASFDQDCYILEQGGSEITVRTRKWGTSESAINFETANGSDGLVVTLYDSEWQEVKNLSYDSNEDNAIIFTVPQEDGVYYLMAKDANAGKVSAKIAPAVARVVVGNEDGGNTGTGQDEDKVYRILLNTYSEEMLTGSSLQLNATVLPAEATGWTISWTSDNEEVATVDQNGKVTACGEGTASITAAIGDIKSSCTITAARYNSAPSVVNGVATHTKIKTKEAHTVDVAAMFTDAENDRLTYSVEVVKASGISGTWDYTYTPVTGYEGTVTNGKYTVSFDTTGVYALMITASDGKLTKTHTYQITVVDNESGVIKLNDGVTLDFYNVVVVGSGVEFVEDYEIPYKGTHDTYVHNIVLSKDTVSGTPHRKMDISCETGYTWAQYSGSGTQAKEFSVRGDIGLFAYDNTGAEKVETAHYLKFYTECQTHTDEDNNMVCDKCTMKLKAGGQFALMVVNADGFVIEPCYVPYATGATVKEALKASGHTFTGIDSGFISAIDGSVDNYSLHYDGDGYSLDTPAAEVTTLWFTSNASQSYSEDLLNLAAQMAKYNTSTNGVKNYVAAKEAYEAAVQDFFQTSNAAKLYTNLKTAMDKYEAFVAGEQVDVSLQITMGGNSITTGRAVFTSEFGTSIELDNLNSVKLVPGNYSFDISDGGFRHVRGSIEVEQAMTLTATLPAGTWMSSLDLGLKSGSANWNAVGKTNVAEGSATYYVPDYAGTSLYPYVVRGEGVETSTHRLYLEGANAIRTWESYSTSLAKVIESNSLNGAKVVLECRLVENPDGYEQYQTFTMDIVRIPSLENLAISGEGTALKLDYVNTTMEYAVTATSASVDVIANGLCAEGTITVAGKAANSGEAVNVTLAECQQDANGAYRIPVVVTAPNGQVTTYTIKVTKVNAVQVNLIAPNTEVEVQLLNEVGAEMAPVAIQDTTYTYQVIPDLEYTYIITANQYYHASAKLTPTEETQTITVAAPKVEDWLAGLAAKAGTSKTAVVYEVTPDFNAAVHTYTTQVESNTTAFYLQAYATDTSAYTTEAIYKTHNNTAYSEYGTLGRQDKVVTPGANSSKYVNMSNFIGNGGWSNEMLVRITQKQEEDGVTYYQDYNITVNRDMTLYSLSAKDNNGNNMPLAQKDDPDTTKFAKLVYDYTAKTGATSQEMSVVFKNNNSTNQYDYDLYTITVACGDWSKDITYDSADEVKAEQTVTVPLSGTVDAETVTITVKHKDTGAVAKSYSIELTKLPPVETTFNVEPGDATIFLMDDTSGGRVCPEAGGSYILNTDASYTYIISRNGYITQKTSFIAGEDNKSIAVSLEKAPESNLKDIAIDGDWLQFREDENNNGVVDVKAPIKAEDAVLEWANKIGEGYDSGATGCPIIVGGYIYTYAGKSIVKVNKETGEVVDSGLMVSSSSFAINSPTYADGMIFVGLSGGRVQAFNAETLESLWVFKDKLGGQPNCPIVYSDGYIYTGFWNSETKQANYVCLSVTDEDTSKTDEEKLPTWTYAHNGFYWAGAYVCEDFVLIGTDDGDGGYTTGYASILSLNPKSGILLDEEKLTNVGDQRSSICYDEATNAYYFTTKGGDFYQIKVNADGTFKEDSLRRLHLDNGANNQENPPMSTSTPVIYNGRAYIGVSGAGQFANYSGHNMTVIDLESFSVAYTVPTMGYPQTSGLLTTAYEETDGYVYVYFIDNATPGVIRVLRDKKGMTEVDHSYTTEATYTSNGKTYTIESGYILFSPFGDEEQYAICSPITDAEGNLYFKNDSARMMRLSSRITSLEITKQPEKLTYEKDMIFDGTGMEVIAHYANGISKNITDYVSYTTEPLTMDDTEITVSFDPDKMFEKEETAEGGYWQWYQDKDGKPGQTYYLPTATVNITFDTEHSWNDGEQTKAPTCTEEGIFTYTCLTCGETKTESIQPKGHQMGEFTVTKESTTTEKGEETSKCANCDHTEKRELPLKEETQTRLEVTEGGIITVPDTLKEVGLDTTEKVNESIATKIIAQNNKIEAKNIAHYDVTMMFSIDGGKTEIKADETHWPADGKLKIVLPYPEGTDSTYNFTVIHMFTSTAYGKTPGEVEIPQVINTPEGIQFEVTGLSPISVGWTAPTSQPGDTTQPDQGDTTPPSQGDTTPPSQGDTTPPSQGDTTPPSQGDATQPGQGENNPSVPGTGVIPSTPTTPGTEGTTTTVPNSPYTGDAAPISVIIMTMLMVGATLTVLWVSKKKYRA